MTRLPWLARWSWLGLLVLLASLTGCREPQAVATTPPVAPAPATAGTPRLAIPEGEMTMAKATFGAGCFWGVEHIFRQVPGVSDVACGYAGGKTQAPTYKQVCYEDTGHAEVVEVHFDPAKVSYEALVKVFFESHDPTTVDRQGPDIGDQYRSVIYYHDEAQKASAQAVMALASEKKLFRAPIVTELTAATTFWRAEDYHQRYYERKGGQPYCHIRRPLF